MKTVYIQICMYWWTYKTFFFFSGYGQRSLKATVLWATLSFKVSFWDNLNNLFISFLNSTCRDLPKLVAFWLRLFSLLSFPHSLLYPDFFWNNSESKRDSYNLTSHFFSTASLLYYLVYCSLWSFLHNILSFIWH